MSDYICAKCGEPLGNNTSEQPQCAKCGSWIFVKQRPNEKKVLKSD